MTLSFSKYQGTGNDFILIDNRDNTFPKEDKIIQKLCDRRFGIGSDGLILIENHADYDYQMVYYNSDGSHSLCGNGSRCGFSFAQKLGVIKDHAIFETTDGVHQAKSEDGIIHFNLFDPKGITQIDEDWYLDTGSPHFVRFMDDIDVVDVVEEGRKIRNLPAYTSQNGTNVNFVQLLKGSVKIRTYERGVENETLSCGTGATAVALVCGQLGMESPVNVETRGGKLKIFFLRTDDNFSDIWLAGPTKKVFEGTVHI